MREKLYPIIDCQTLQPPLPSSKPLQPHMPTNYVPRKGNHGQSRGGYRGRGGTSITSRGNGLNNQQTPKNKSVQDRLKQRKVKQLLPIFERNKETIPVTNSM